MKKYLMGIIAIVLAITFSAFTTSVNKKVNLNKQTFTWHKYNAAGTAELSPIVSFTGDASQAKDQFQCPDGNTVKCARAYNAVGNPLDVFIMKISE